MTSQPVHSTFNLGFALHPLGASFPVEGCIEVIDGERVLHWYVPSSIVPQWRQGPDIAILTELFLWAVELECFSYCAIENGIVVYSRSDDGDGRWHVKKGGECEEQRRDV